MYNAICGESCRLSDNYFSAGLNFRERIGSSNWFFLIMWGTMVFLKIKEDKSGLDEWCKSFAKFRMSLQMHGVKKYRQQSWKEKKIPLKICIKIFVLKSCFESGSIGIFEKGNYETMIFHSPHNFYFLHF